MIKFLKKIFSKKKINIGHKFLNTNNFNSQILYSNHNKKEINIDEVIITSLISFDKNYLDSYFEFNNLNLIRNTIKEYNGIYYCYLYGKVEDYKLCIKYLNTNNIFFSGLKEILSNINILFIQDLVDDNIITDFQNAIIKPIEDYKILQHDISKIKDIFTIDELSKVICIKYLNENYTYENKNNSIFQYLIDYEKYKNRFPDMSTYHNLYYNLLETYGENIINNIITPNYKLENKIENFEDSIFEPLEEPIESEYEITEDDDGNLIYDKNYFE